ncbi:class II fructose-bisphosphate aldolase [Leptospirillum ferriphilum]|jgi:fructose/tagatose bisphosphate aldolase|uniref:Aldolase n=2 Tax=Leptospirillum ferriphilum TaxID=178606 RepID=A0A059XW03_9BACT|nr:class II fructose-bisphosphate aldolase [Leptospirillum ferriphilum]AIA31250.1 aldolase [Leptospirillum ferriphilum YSK]OOH71658.1 aldolase [Leptospirillum ferriphilum]OOH77894.1 aldolase [Leptospirillum ferriphilum]
MNESINTGEKFREQYRLVADFSGNEPVVTDLERFRTRYLASAIGDLLFQEDRVARKMSFELIRSAFQQSGAWSESIDPLYRAIGKGEVGGFTVPAINIRGLTFETARAVFRAIRSIEGGPVIFELAKSEIGYTGQRPMEYAGLIMAAAFQEKVQGPVFIQGDHYQVNASRYREAPEKEIEDLKYLIQESLDAGYGNIDIDASTLVRLEPEDLREQQRENGRVTAQLTHFIRQISTGAGREKNHPVSVGGEIGEVGKENSTPAELEAFMEVYQEHLARLGQREEGISKISVQTGTSHGGVPLADGSIKKVALDFAALEALSRLARERYRMGGAVQHGASTLPEEMFDQFPKVGTLEIHLATGFQNLLLDHPLFPKELYQKSVAYLKEAHKKEWKEGETEEQFVYKNRKRIFGPFKKDLSLLPEKAVKEIMQSMEERFILIFKKLGLSGTRSVIDRYFPGGE